MRDREYADVRGRVLAAARRMPEELYAFRAVPEIRGFGGEVHHLASVDNRLCAIVAQGGEPVDDWSAGAPAVADGKTAVLAYLVRSLERCDSALAALTDELAMMPTFGPYVRSSTVVAMLGHTWSAYGKVTVMMRLNGIAPR